LLVYGPGQEGTRELTLVDRAGRQEQIVRDSASTYFTPRWSPDGQRVAVGYGPDVWIYDILRKTMSRLTVNEGASALPVWTPDGRRITFVCTKGTAEETCWKPADGSSPTQVFPRGRDFFPLAWSPDGTALIATRDGDLWALPADTTKPLRRITDTPSYSEFEASVSPDGRWLALTSNESGRFEVYVQPLLGSGTRWQVSTGGGQGPDWSPNGRELFYISADDHLTAVDIIPGSNFTMGGRKVLFRMSSAVTHIPRSYDIHPDGQRFVVGVQRGPDRLIVVTNWFDELVRATAR
jgi:Tol biopolymer transport system component